MRTKHRPVQKIVVAAPRRPYPSYFWPSIKEILSAIEESWEELAARGRHEVRLIRPHRQFDPADIAEIMRSDMLVIPYLQEAAAWALLKNIRHKLKLPIPCMIYSHGEATAGGGIHHLQEMAQLLGEGDILLCSSSADARALRLCFPRARITVLPFPLSAPLPGSSSPEDAGRSPRRKKLRPRRIVYAGRISEQKNLHTLLLALHILSRQHPQFQWRADIYGKPDRLGSPNMGFRMKNYGGHLKSLSRALGLGDKISWRGHLRQRDLQRALLGDPHVFVSPSLHADENFGVAALKSLLLGNPAVLSDWGGHRDLKRRFPASVYLVPARDSEIGPHIRAEELAEKLVKVFTRASAPAVAANLHAYTAEFAASRLNELLSFQGNIQGPFTPLRLSRLHRLRISRLTRARSFRDSRARWPRPFLRAETKAHLYKNYADRLAKPFFLAYGLREARSRGWNSEKQLIVAPWAKVRGSRILVRDPHRGPWVHASPPNRPAIGQRRRVRDIAGKSFLVTEAAARWLLQTGLAFYLQSP